MRKTFHNIIGFLFAAAASGSATASSQGPGIVSLLHIMDNGSVIFVLSGTRSAQPPCSTQGRWVFDANTPAGQAKLSVILSAYHTQKPLVIYGKATCLVWGDTETVDYLHTVP